MVVVKKKGTRRVKCSGRAALSYTDVAEGSIYSARSRGRGAGICPGGIDHCWRPLLFHWKQPMRNMFHGCFWRYSQTTSIEIFKKQIDYFFWNSVKNSNCYFLGNIISTSLMFLLEYFIKYFPWNSVNIPIAISPVIYMQFIHCF